MAEPSDSTLPAPPIAGPVAAAPLAPRWREAPAASLPRSAPASAAALAAATEQVQAGVEEELSPPALLLGRLAPRPLPEAERGQALAPVVLARVAEAPEAAATALRAAVRRSGLFYEAHLRSWHAGKFPREELLREPQARAAAAPPGAAGSLEPLLREQLAVRDSRTVVVPLIAWPGQPATLSLAQDEPSVRDGKDGKARPPAAERPWRASLRIELPRLGALELGLQLRGGQLDLSLRAENAASGAELRSRAAELGAALADRSLTLARVALAGHEQ